MFIPWTSESKRWLYVIKNACTLREGHVISDCKSHDSPVCLTEYVPNAKPQLIMITYVINGKTQDHVFEEKKYLKLVCHGRF